jgi:cation diffusion facilitator family transporter
LSRKRSRHSDYVKFILLALLKNGSLSLEDLKKLTLVFVAQFEIFSREFGSKIVSRFFLTFASPATVRSSKERKKEEAEVNIELDCDKLLKNGSIEINEAHKYQLTAKGQGEATRFSQNLENTAGFLEKQVIGHAAAARNTIFVDLFLAVIKLAAGFFGGSVGLLSDGTDATIDTLSASVSWAGIRLKKESIGAFVTILMMFVGGCTIAYESITKIIDVWQGTASPLSLPFLVIGVELVAMAFALFLFLYQRFTGKRNGSLALISQSVDSKNHIYISTIVIVGAVFSIFGIPLADGLVGALVAGRILLDAGGLSKEMLLSMKGEEINLSKYEIPLEKEWELSKFETFRIWTLYSIKEEKLKSREELISMLEKTFKPEYIPIISEFRFSLGKSVDFHESFDAIMAPLLSKGLLIQQKEGYSVTDEGVSFVNRTIKNTRLLRPYV